jgi:putative nucleotidyltransferase with HDIG domain
MNKTDLLKILKKLQDRLPGRVYAVGGCLRNLLLKKTFTDIDLAVDLDPQTVLKILQKSSDITILSQVLDLGVIKFQIQIQDQQFYLELTSFRQETYKKTSRFPKVSFKSDLATDSSRRDFTINSLYLTADGQLLDPTGCGLDDLENKLLRTVHDPNQAFFDDPLRILRAARFIAEYDLDYENSWNQLLPDLKTQLFKVTKVLWLSELDGILAASYAPRGLDFLQKQSLFDVLIPHLSLQLHFNQNNPYHDFDLWKHTLNVVQNTPQNQLDLRWAALLHDIAKPYTKTYDINTKTSHFYYHQDMGAELVAEIANRLGFDKSRKDFVVDCIKNHLKSISPLKGYDDAEKKLPQNYQPKSLVIVGGGDSYINQQDFIAKLQTQELRLSGGSSWTAHLALELNPWMRAFKLTMPNKDNAQYLEWKVRFERYAELFLKQSVLVGWSLGGLFLLQLLTDVEFNLKNTKILELHLVAPAYPEVGDFRCDLDNQAIKRLFSKVAKENIYIHHSTDDFVVNYKDSQKLAADLILPKENFKSYVDRNHFLIPQYFELEKHLLSLVKPG